MFAKDIDILNKLYCEAVNLGPMGDNSPDTGLSPTKVERIPCKRKCLKCPPTEECEQPDFDESNADMSKQSLFRIFKLSAMLHDLICKEQHVEPWVLAKITEAHQHLEAVFGYKDYESYKGQFERDLYGIDEDNEEDLYNSINTGGTNLINKIKNILTQESKETLEQILYETITALEKK